MRSANTGGRLDSTGPSFAQVATGRTRHAACCAGSPAKLKVSGSKLQGPIVVTTMAGNGRLGLQLVPNASKGAARTRMAMPAARNHGPVNPAGHQLLNFRARWRPACRSISLRPRSNER
jgi:hypothetical protein